MSQPVAPGADHVAAAHKEASEEVLLWRAPWFRVLTLINCTIILASAVSGLIMGTPGAWSWGGSWGWLFIAFPVVPVLFGAPVVWFAVLGVACALSLLNTVGRRHKEARFFHALTIWGTIVLTCPMLFTAFIWLTSLRPDAG